MALDLGDVRIGVAVSDPMGIIAQPHSVIPCISPKKDAEAVAKLAELLDIRRLVVGLPLDKEGKQGPQALKVLAFIDVLRPLMKSDIVTQDERFTTAEAQRMLIHADVSRKNRKKVVDKIAAQFILQTYLERQSRIQTPGT
jgi:putative Holliday junction resolvase